MGTVMLLSLMATTIALSIYFMWKAFGTLPKQPILNRPPQNAEIVDGGAFGRQHSA